MKDRWYDYGNSADVDRIKYGYNRAGNRTYRENTVADALGKHFDELYGNDAIQRLKDLERGTLNGTYTAITNKSFAECWSLDETGNWKEFLEDSNGDSTWDLDQARTSNEVNEITDITETTGPSWVTPVYNKPGNMTTMPQPGGPTSSYAATYDAWNRLVKVEEGASTVAEYEYDGGKRRIVQKIYASGSLDETRHFFYSNNWQVLEERIDAETDPESQHVWGLRYIDDCVLRDRDTTNNGTLNERLYALQDANWNVDALVNSSGIVQERFAYSAYGAPLFLNASFVPQVSSSSNWSTLYTGYRWDNVTELFHVRNRAYHSGLGSWVQRDPLGLSAGVNLYQYTGSTPVNGVDPNGLSFVIPLNPAVLPFISACMLIPLCAAALYAGVAIAALIAIYSIIVNWPPGGGGGGGRRPRRRRRCNSDCRKRNPTWPSCSGPPSADAVANTFLAASCGGKYRITSCYTIAYKPGKSCQPPGNGSVVHCNIESINGGVKTPKHEISIVCCNCCRGKRASQSCESPHWSSNSGGKPPLDCF